MGIQVSTSAQNSLVWKAIKPTLSPKPVQVVVMGRELNYYPLEKDKNIEVTLQGPTTLRVLSRLEFAADESGEKRYYLHYQNDGGSKSDFSLSTTLAANATLLGQSQVRLGTSRSEYIEVPEGKHVYRFSAGGKATYRLYLRFYVQSAESSAEAVTVAFAPSQFTTLVTLAVKENELPYYRLGQQDSVKLSVIGPTTLEVLARLEFDPTMVTDQKFRLKTFEDGLEKQVFSLRSKPSGIAEYSTQSDKIAGQAAKFYVEIPRGKHDYTFEIVDDGRSALLRFYIPKKDLTNNL